MKKIGPKYDGLVNIARFIFYFLAVALQHFRHQFRDFFAACHEFVVCGVTDFHARP